MVADGHIIWHDKDTRSIGPVFAEFCYAQITESYILGPHLPVPLAGDHAVAYLRAKMITINLIL